MPINCMFSICNIPIFLIPTVQLSKLWGLKLVCHLKLSSRLLDNFTNQRLEEPYEPSFNQKTYPQKNCSRQHAHPTQPHARRRA